jgi:long-chain acyl-CoA synthetase
MNSSYMDAYPDVPICLSEQLKRCSNLFPNKTAVIDAQYSITWKQLFTITDIIVDILLEKNVEKGDRIIVAMERRYDIVPAYLAIARLGAVSVPFNFKASEEEQRKIVQLVEPVGGLYHEDILAELKVSEHTGWSYSFDAKNITHFKHPPNYNIERAAKKLPDVFPDDAAYLNMTSGSTGDPKAAIATHRQLYGNTRACVEQFKLNENDVHLPLFAVMAHPHEIFCRALFTGGSIVLLENFYPRTIIETIEKHRVTCMMAVPPIFNLLVPFLAEKKYDISSLNLPESGGMTTPPSLLYRFYECSGIPLVPVWGSTESMGVALAAEMDGSTPHHSVGKPLPGYIAKIVDRNGNDCPSGEIGELCLHGTGIMDRYWNNPDVTLQCLKDGWYHTGDLFEMDDEGNYYFRGRLDAMMKVAGLKIYPAEIEAALFSHPLVRDAVVVPLDDSERGIVPMALIVIEPGETIPEIQLRHFLLTKLSSAKMPRVFRFLPDLPRTPSGKVDRKVLLRYANINHKPTDESLERRLEAIDLKILHLLNERLRIENAIKTDMKTARFQPDRIEETIQRLLAFNPGPLHDSVVEELFMKILSLGTLY